MDCIKKKEVLKFDHVHLNYFSDKNETLALNDVNFNIYEGEFVSLVGPSGCGKTTILSLISSLIRPTSGNISICGEIIKKNDKKNNFLSKKTQKNKNFIGYMFQKDHLFEWRTVEKNIALGLEIQNKKTPQSLEFAKSLLQKYGLYEFKDKYPNELSGGMRQRVALIRTLVLHPKIMLLDEAFSALDYQTRLSVCDDIYDILKNEKITSILVTHDISEAIAMSDRVVVLSQRPASVKNIHEIQIDDCKTPFQRRESSEAKEYFDLIWKELRNEN